MMASRPQVVEQEGNTTVLEVVCPECQEPKRLQVRTDAWRNRLLNGGAVQVCFPDMPAAERELLVSGTCGKCWEALFG